MIICGIDLETSGLTLGKAGIIEVACVLYDTGLRAPYKFFSTLVWSNSHLPPEEEALKVNGLTLPLLQRHGVDTKTAMVEVAKYMDSADCMMGHNALSFDKPFIEWEFKMQHMKERYMPWIDTRVDLEYPPHMTSRRLSHLAVDHGIYNPLAHRALFDTFVMLQIAQNYDLDKAFERCKSPLIRIEAMVNYDTRQKAKDARFNWDPEKQVWYKTIREIDFTKEANSVNFVIKKV